MSSEKIDYISIEGFKSLRSIERLPLAPINVLIGANGSGKSNFVGAFSFLRELREGHLQDYVRQQGGAEQILHFGSKVTKSLRFHLSFSRGVNRYEVTLKPTEDDSLFVSSEAASFWDNSRGFDPDSPLRRPLRPLDGGQEAGISDPRTTGIPAWVRARLAIFRLYHVHDTSSSSPMRKTSNVDDNHYLRQDAADLGAFLYLLQENHADDFAMVRSAVRRVAPYFDDFLLKPDPRHEETIRLAWRHKGSEQYFGASSLSDGTLRFIALATLFLQPAKFRPAAIVIDEPELGLHPTALTILAALVKQAATETQVVLSTQSALLLDHFQPEDVLVAERQDNRTTIERLDPERFSEWLQDYSLGQLWEKNEIGGRP